MSISSISSATVPRATDGVQDPGASFRTAFRAVAEAIESGDLASARTAFGSLQQIGNPQPSPDKNDDKLKEDFANLGKALQSGDLKTAKKALLALRADARNIHGGKRHRDHRHVTSQDATPTTPTTPTTSTKTPDVAAVLGDLGAIVNTIA